MLQPVPLDPSPSLDPPGALYGNLQQSASQPLRAGGTGRGILDRAQHRRLERRLVLFEIKGHLLIGDPTEQRSDDEQRDQNDHTEPEHDSESGDGRIGEA